MSNFAKPPAAEEFLTLFNEAMRRGENDLRSQLPTSPLLPTFFIVGPPRTGTTVLLQWLNKSPHVSVPSNILARFYGAPYLGSLVQRLLTDPDLGYRDELALGLDTGTEFTSVIGKTVGLTSAHEFFYFWRQYFPVGLPSQLSEESWRNADSAGFAAGLARIESALGSALALKGIILQYNLVELSELLPKSVFLITHRDEVTNVESLLHARRTAASEDQWFSVQPPGWQSLLTEAPLIQAAGQVAWTNDDLQEQAKRISPERVVYVNYEQLCDSPADIWHQIDQAARFQGHSGIGSSPAAPLSRSSRRSQRESEVVDALQQVRANRSHLVHLERPRRSG